MNSLETSEQAGALTSCHSVRHAQAASQRHHEIEDRIFPISPPVSIGFERVAFLLAQRAEDRLGRERQFGKPHADRVVDSVGDGGR
jgi:hypothetical protein